MKETRIEFRILCSDTMLNYRLSQKIKLLRYEKFNHLTNTSNMNKSFNLQIINKILHLSQLSLAKVPHNQDIIGHLVSINTTAYHLTMQSK